jgi:hypothetical protein
MLLSSSLTTTRWKDRFGREKVEAVGKVAAKHVKCHTVRLSDEHQNLCNISAFKASVLEKISSSSIWKRNWVIKKLKLHYCKVSCKKEHLETQCIRIHNKQNRKWKNYIISKSLSLINQIKIRSQHPQDPAQRRGNKCMDELLPHEGIQYSTVIVGLA